MLGHLLAEEPSAVHERLREVEVAELSPEEARQLASELLQGQPDVPRRADAIARESGGVPFFVSELARFSADEEYLGQRDSAVPLQLDEVIRWRASQLPQDARQLLEVVATGGRPTPVGACLQAAGLEPGELKALALLRSQHLVRSRHGESGEEVTVYYNRVREGVLADLSPVVLESHHLQLAEALEGTVGVDPERLAVHFAQAGEAERALDYAVQAADLAFKALAFDRAARLYRLALESGGRTQAGAVDLWEKLGHSLANAGRGPEAAEAYLEAARDRPAEEALDLRQQAAYQLLSTGHMEQGLDVLREVLGAVGMKLPDYGPLDWVRVFLVRAWMRLRGLGFRRRNPDEIPSTLLLAADACWAAMTGLVIANPLLGWLDFHTRSLLLSLRAGEAVRVARDLASEAYGLLLLGRQAAAHRVAEQALALAEEIQSPRAVGYASTIMGLSYYWGQMRWSQAVEAHDRGARILRDRCAGVQFELSVAQSAVLWPLFYLGRIRELSERLPPLLRDARQRGDVFAQWMLAGALSLNRCLLVADDLAAAREEVPELLRQVRKQNLLAAEWDAYLGLCQTVERELYAGNGGAAWLSVLEEWPRFQGSFFMRTKTNMENEAWFARAQAALGAAVGSEGSERRALLGQARRAARRIRRCSRERCEPFRQLVRAGIESIRGRPQAALQHLAAAQAGFEANDMALHAAVCRRRRGQLLGDEEGSALVAEADAWMSGETIKMPSRVADMLAPGRWDQ
jgi:hypothetical protein